MTRFVGSETKVIQATWWDRDEWVEIKRFSFLDERLIVRVMTLITVADGGELIKQFDSLAWTVAYLEAGVVAWWLKGPDGQPVPVTREWIARLAPDDGDFILGGILALNEDLQQRRDIVLRGMASLA